MKHFPSGFGKRTQVCTIFEIGHYQTNEINSIECIYIIKAKALSHTGKGFIQYAK